MTRQKVVHVVSDSVGETAELVVKAVASQFNGGHVEINRHSFIESTQDIDEAINSVDELNSLIAYTLVIPELKEYLDRRSAEKGIFSVDLLSPLLHVFEDFFKQEAKHQPKLIRRMDEAYFKKIEAIEFSVKYDDGKDPRGLKWADLVLIGVSRTSKTPLAMYLAHHGYRVANVPIVPEVAPPKEIFEIPRSKCVGLTISPEKLNEVRKERLKSMGLNAESNYASMERIFEELDYANRIMKRIGCPIIDVSNKAIEETANLIIHTLKRGRGL
ncbi:MULTISPECIES: pyruvate, water dikinase regulatory protein [Bacillaceae]|nr:MULTISPECIES: pyruvate, water dikinase regulatory protein [Bacillaceae]MCB5935097.1 kinase/pyrophosphorylase [Bacillus sp. DFI.2.34]MCB7076977.1 kinase/pyrophosphorylase [Caldibacillus thermoamylovorans]MDL0419378.1 pyruvate, water dikinase regulatory protein [Caldibacillus thermoamylovorans]MEC5272924.1 kinase/pyrophosphorylase [Caldifermentibacillus hisashii]